jgi:hypothetical protein
MNDLTSEEIQAVVNQLKKLRLNDIDEEDCLHLAWALKKLKAALE